MTQSVFDGSGSIRALSDILQELGAKRCLLVHGRSLKSLPIHDQIAALDIQLVPFCDFTPNPQYAAVCKGVQCFRTQRCDAILAVGGGSAMDVAKCIKLFCRMQGDGGDGAFLTQPFSDSGIPLIAVPTTAGTGSESTRFAVIYHGGQKQSIAHESIVPNAAILDARVLPYLPLYQKKCTLLDALCQGIESFWSVHATEESKALSKRAIASIIGNMDAYLTSEACDGSVSEAIMRAANISGQAINITQTTAAHAMSYRLGSMYHLPHGHAVAVCLPHIWRYMINSLSACAEPRGGAYLAEVFQAIARALGQSDAEKAIEWFEDMLARLGIDRPHTANAADIAELTQSVNPIRLRNNPVRLTEEAIRALYGRIVVVDAG